MDSFYSHLAAEAEDESDGTMNSMSSKPQIVNRPPANDIDDLLDEFEFTPRKQPARQKGDRLVLPESKPTPPAAGAGSSSLLLNDTPSSTSSTNDQVSKPPKARRNILDSLLSMDEDFMDCPGGESDDYDTKMGQFENTSKAQDSAPPDMGTKTASKRSVRFCDGAAAENDCLGESLSSSDMKNSVRSDQSVERPQTAPQPSKKNEPFSSSLWGANDNFDWPPRRTRTQTDFKAGIQKAASSIALLEETELNQTLTDVKPSSRDKSPSENISAIRLITDPDAAPALTKRPSISKVGKDKVLDARPSHASSEPIMPFIISTPKESPLPCQDSFEISNRVKHLEAKLQNLQNILKMTKEYHQDEIKMLQESHSCKIHFLEENARRREEHLKEEMEFNVSRCRQRVSQLEQHEEAMRADLLAAIEAVKQDSAKTIESLRLEHSTNLDVLTTKHQQTLASLRQAALEETRVLSETQPTAEALRNLIEHLLAATTDLQKAESDRHGAAAQQIAQLHRKEEAIRQAEERLRLQEKESDKVHQTLTEEVTKIELQLREQAKLLADDRWMLRQEQGRLTKLLVNLEEDRRAVVEHAGRECGELQELMTNFFAEHRETRVRLSAERNLILEQQQRLRADQLCWRKRQEEEEAKLNKLREEVSAEKATFQVERHSLDERIHQIRLNEAKLGETQHHLDIIRNELANKETTLSAKILDLEHKEEELSAKASEIFGKNAAVLEIDARCNRMREEQGRIQAELSVERKELDLLERKLSEERTELEHREKELDKKLKADKKLVCNRCKHPVKRVPKQNRSSNKRDPSTDDEHMTVTGDQQNVCWAQTRGPDHFRSNLPGVSNANAEAVKLVQDVSDQFSRNRVLEQLKQELAKDTNFLEDERIFLNGLQHSPYM